MCFCDYCCLLIVAGSIGALLILTLIVIYCSPEKKNKEKKNEKMEKRPLPADWDVPGMRVQQHKK